MPPAAAAQPQNITEIFDGADEEDTVVVPPEPVKLKIDSDLIEMAEDLGMTKDQVRSIEPDKLAAYLRGRIRQMRDSSLAQSQRDAERSVVERARVAPAKEPEVVDEPFDLDPADYEPKVFAQLKRAYEDRLDRKKEQSLLKGLIEREQLRENRSWTEIIDKSFESLGDGYERAFGKGDIGDLDPASSESERRKSVFDAAKRSLPANPSPRQVEKAIRSAAERLYGHVLPPAKPAQPVSAGGYGDLDAETVMRDDPPPRIKDPNTGRFVSRDTVNQIDRDLGLASNWATPTAAPTSRRGRDEPFGTARAERSVAAILQNSPVDAGSSGSATMDDFPDT